MILIYVHALAATGVVRNARILAADFAARGHAVELVTALPGGEGVPGVRHIALLAGPGRSRALEKLRAVLALRRHLRRSGQAVLLSAGNHGHAVAWAAAQGLGRVKRIYRISNDIVRDIPGAPVGRFARRWRLALARILAADADRLVLVSQSLADTPAFASAQAQDRVTVIPNAIDAVAARARIGDSVPHPWLAGPDPVVLAIGRLAPQKNFETLMQAFAALRAVHPARLIILGESRDRACDTLRASARALGVADAVALPGTVANVFPWLARADVFTLPSWWEGAANVLLEAMAVGIPVVASRSAGNAADLLDEGQFGRLIDPADAQTMADALALQIDAAMVIRPGDRIARYGLNVASDAWERLISEVCERITR